MRSRRRPRRGGSLGALPYELSNVQDRSRLPTHYVVLESAARIVNMVSLDELQLDGQDASIPSI